MIGINPFARDGGADVGLVLVIAGDDLDRRAEHLPTKILDRHLGGEDRTPAADVGVEARHVVEHTELDDPVGDLRRRRRAPENARGECEVKFAGDKAHDDFTRRFRLRKR